jgi:hypothetical protein
MRKPCRMRKLTRSNKISEISLLFLLVLIGGLGRSGSEGRSGWAGIVFAFGWYGKLPHTGPYRPIPAQSEHWKQNRSSQKSENRSFIQDRLSENHCRWTRRWRRWREPKTKQNRGTMMSPESKLEMRNLASIRRSSDTELL